MGGSDVRAVFSRVSGCFGFQWCGCRLGSEDRLWSVACKELTAIGPPFSTCRHVPPSPHPALLCPACSFWKFITMCLFTVNLKSVFRHLDATVRCAVLRCAVRGVLLGVAVGVCCAAQCCLVGRVGPAAAFAAATVVPTHTVAAFGPMMYLPTSLRPLQLPKFQLRAFG